MQKIAHEIKHYYHGFRLLALETRLSAKYMWRVLRGDTLSRRERQQLVRTVSDLFRLVPFSIFIIVPFMELALPIFIKLFPNMLPSTFQESGKEEEKLRKQVKVKVEMAKFLQDTIEEIALERRSNATEPHGSKAVEFAQFIKKVRSEGGYVSNEELFKFSKLFEDELTLDNLSMSQLRSLCRLMSIQPFGSPEILRFQLNLKLRELKTDDMQIAAEGGVDALSTIDLQQACRARGMRAIGLSEDRLRDQLKQWLELSLSDKVPPSLLLLSRALYLPEDISFTNRLKALVQNLPEGKFFFNHFYRDLIKLSELNSGNILGIAESTRQKLTEMEGGQVDHKERLNLIRQIEEAIAKEKAMEEEKIRGEKKQKILQEETEHMREEQLPEIAQVITTNMGTFDERNEKANTVSTLSDTIKKQSPSLVHEVGDLASASDRMNVTTVESATTVDHKDLSSIEQILVGGPIHEAKHDILGLKEKAIEHSEDLVEITALDSAFSETKVAQRLRTKLNTMIDSVDTLVSKLEEKKRTVEETVVDPAMAESVMAKRSKQVRIQDLIDALMKIQTCSTAMNESSNETEQRCSRIEKLLLSIDQDADGIIDGDLMLEVISLLERHGDVKLSTDQIASVVSILKKECEFESLDKNTESRAHSPNKDQQGSASFQTITSGERGLDEPSQKLNKEIVDIPNVDPQLITPLRSKNKNDSGKIRSSQNPKM
ncbi:LETM1-like protein [Dictyocaulus viviparus]|uniref:LETM1-like protein n=1 Tax=Dictyocaulus viviparus TaxID=29172 RepID=A0A0D8XLE2_DICVI|nr:LETM1-like protein [Dictyocaulus viviparus]